MKWKETCVALGSQCDVRYVIGSSPCAGHVAWLPDLGKPYQWMLMKSNQVVGSTLPAKVSIGVAGSRAII